jgi:hypothetical protein
MKDELREAIAAFVAACARHCLMADPNPARARLELRTAWFAMVAAWDRWAP